MTINKDMLAKKKAQLDMYNLRYDNSVALVTNTLDTLNNLNSEIEATMAEIETYIGQLLETRDELGRVHKKNAKVIDNFRKLLEV